MTRVWSQRYRKKIALTSRFSAIKLTFVERISEAFGFPSVEK